MSKGKTFKKLFMLAHNGDIDFQVYWKARKNYKLAKQVVHDIKLQEVDPNDLMGLPTEPTEVVTPVTTNKSARSSVWTGGMIERVNQFFIRISWTRHGVEHKIDVYDASGCFPLSTNLADLLVMAADPDWNFSDLLVMRAEDGRRVS
jgi:hypothetical protein